LQAQPLSKLITEMGGQVFHCPTIRIDWLSPELSDLANIHHFNKIIFTSANAVEGWLKSEQESALKTGLKSTQFGGKLYAIGKATRQKGEAFGLKVETLSQTQFDSEHFLAHTEMRSVKGDKIALIKGQGGRALIEQTLGKRGAILVPIDVYKRSQLDFCTSQWQKFIESDSPILLISSLESWQNLLNGLQKNQESVRVGDALDVNLALKKLVGLVVMSQRIAQEISLSGCLTNVQVVHEQSNQGIANAIRDLIEAKL